MTEQQSDKSEQVDIEAGRNVAWLQRFACEPSLSEVERDSLVVAAGVLAERAFRLKQLEHDLANAIKDHADDLTAPLPECEPTKEMIEAGAQRLVRWETGKEKWPDAWSDLDVRAARNDAERCWRSMWLAAQKKNAAPLTKNAAAQEAKASVVQETSEAPAERL